MTIRTQFGVSVSYALVREALANTPGPPYYTMSLPGGSDFARAVTEAVNRHPIDSRLEACFVPDRGDKYESVPDLYVGSRLECRVSRESLPVLLRRLFEATPPEGYEEPDSSEPFAPWYLADTILATLGIDECGTYTRTTEGTEAE